MKGYVLKSGATYLGHDDDSFHNLLGAQIFKTKAKARNTQFLVGGYYKIVPVEIKVVGVK